jgi:hypothetical protein
MIIAGLTTASGGALNLTTGRNQPHNEGVDPGEQWCKVRTHLNSGDAQLGGGGGCPTSLDELTMGYDQGRDSYHKDVCMSVDTSHREQ